MPVLVGAAGGAGAGGAGDDCSVIHSPKFMRELDGAFQRPDARSNPLYEELLEIARMARVIDFILLDVTLTQSRQISGVFAGEPVAAHAAGVNFLRTTSLEKLTGLADAVIEARSGTPAGSDLLPDREGNYVGSAHREAGCWKVISVLGACPEGIGSPEFARSKLREYRGSERFLAELLDAPVR